MWRVRQRLTQPASGSGNTICASHGQSSKLVKMIFPYLWRLGEPNMYLCIQNWACYLWWLTISKLLYSISRCKRRWSQMTLLSLVWAWDSRRWSEGHGVMETHLEDDLPGATLNIISSCHCYHSHCHPWWSSSANNSFSENIDRENRYSEWHSELLIWEWIRYCYFSWSVHVDIRLCELDNNFTLYQI